jgi:tetratricopeptide (TPR) repeat protein
LDRSEEFYRKAFKESEDHEIIEFYPNSLLNLSDLAMMKKQYVESKKHARMIVMSADSINKSRNLMPLAYENLGNASLYLKQPDSALTFFRKMDESLAHTDPLYNGPDILLETRIQLGLGKSYLDLGDMEKGKSALRQALAMSDESGLNDAKQEASELLASMAEEVGDYREALTHFKIFKSASDSLLNEDRLKELAIKETMFRFEEKEKIQQMELDQLHEKEKRQQVFVISLSILAVLLTSIIVLIIRLQVLKSRKVKLEKEKLEADLKYKNRELATSVLQMMKKNEFIMNIVPRLKKIALSSPKSLNGEVRSIIKDIEFDSKEIGWNEFELRFKEVHSAYYDKLLAKFPTLTKNEQRLCAFLKLKMTTKEISSITFQSEHSINVARSRMKKKMGLPAHKRLIQFLSNL